MSTVGLIYLTLFVLAYLASSYGLMKLFEKAEQPGWAAFVPIYRNYIWLKVIERPLWWLALTLIPVARTLIKISMDIDLARAFGRYKWSEQALAVLASFYYYPKIGLDPAIRYLGPVMTYPEAYKLYEEKGKRDLVQMPKKADKATQRKIYDRNYSKLAANFPNVQPPKSSGREWADALLFAGVAAIIIRTFMFEAFMIPTSSMERTLMAGDFLIVSKYPYGIRMPMTPLSIPIVHNKIKIGTFSMPSYIGAVQLPYYRTQGFDKVERNDIVVFNYPAHDIHDYDNTGFKKPITMKDNYIKRCVAVAGDTLAVRDGQVYLNGEIGKNPEMMQFRYNILAPEGLQLTADRMKALGLRTDEVGNRAQPALNNQNWGAGQHTGLYWATLTEKSAAELAALPQVDSVMKEILPDGVMMPGIYPYFQQAPNRRFWQHNRDNFGPVVVPARGLTISLTDPANILLYQRVIEAYEGKDFRVQNNQVLIDGEPTTTYTFEWDYYFMMGDNRHNSEDSRFWGFVPETHIVGRPALIFFSYESNFGFRFDRIGTKYIR